MESSILDKIDCAVAIIDLASGKILDSNQVFLNWLAIPHREAADFNTYLPADAVKKIKDRGKLSFERDLTPITGRPFPGEFVVKKLDDVEAIRGLDGASQGRGELFLVQILSGAKAREKEALLKSATTQIDLNNRHLSRQKREMADLLDNMRQAVFTITKDLKVHGTVSKYTSTVWS